MIKTFKTNLLLLLAIIITAVLVVSGCSANLTATPDTNKPASTTTTKAISPFTQAELNQLLTDSINSNKNAHTYKFSMSMNMKVKVDGKAGQGDMNIVMNGAADVVASIMQIIMNMETPDDSGKKQSQQIDMYLMDGNLYMKVSIANGGEQWIKTKATEQILKSFDVDFINKQMEGFAAPDAIEYIREDTARGVSCYVLKITPNAEYLRESAEANMTQGMVIDWDKVKNVQDLYKNMNSYVWITKDTKELIKTEAIGTMEFTSDFAHSSQLKFKTFVLDADTIAEIYDRGVAINIKLPAEAQNAQEIPASALLGE
jgi:hypothetical protein